MSSGGAASSTGSSQTDHTVDITTSDQVNPMLAINYEETDSDENGSRSKLTVRFSPSQKQPAKPRKVKYRQYCSGDLLLAFKAVTKRNYSCEKAAKEFGVPVTTLKSRVHGKVSLDNEHSGPKPILNAQDERRLVEHLTFMSSIGYGYTRGELVSIATEFASHLDKIEKGRSLTDNWYRGFIKRWPQLELVRPGKQTSYVALATNPAVLANYFKELHRALTKNKLLDKPELIYNIDECGISLEFHPPKVLHIKGTKGLKNSMLSVYGCGNAHGTSFPPFFVFPGKRFTRELISSGIPVPQGVTSDTGYSNSLIFQEYLQKYFLDYAEIEQNGGKCFVLYDAHKSHVNPAVIRWAKEHKIILYPQPPLYKGCFRNLQEIFNVECRKFMMKNKGLSLTKSDLCSFVCHVYPRSLTVETLQQNFKELGVCPYSPKAITTNSQYAFNVQPVSLKEGETRDDDDDSSGEDDDSDLSDNGIISDHDSVEMEENCDDDDDDDENVVHDGEHMYIDSSDSKRNLPYAARIAEEDTEISIVDENSKPNSKKNSETGNLHSYFLKYSGEVPYTQAERDRKFGLSRQESTVQSAVESIASSDTSTMLANINSDDQSELKVQKTVKKDLSHSDTNAAAKPTDSKSKTEPHIQYMQCEDGTIIATVQHVPEQTPAETTTETVENITQFETSTSSEGGEVQSEM
ncbi:hypothetical protein ScPMuIL_012566 [Solemya velum]